ncbi:GNAT family N-acetyltransferase [Glycomyces luteolus]|uniref:GNAT family N-acetyltransferase n=1 Tax=Glycomyces luteolus TaxID=2670330 RepID=A0A9X3SQ91_9ACTN|nr:GNAT family N-acetyltransferase [Glycomyces luteolus]MDA1360267.1 GNAT family N-acetyltransferase [Glycomyces luteolus]
MTDAIILLNRLPTSAEHRRLAEAVGWTEAFDWDTMPASLAGSLAGEVALDGDDVVGMGRLVGDGVKYFYVQDLAVLPEYQGVGIGTALLQRLLDHVANTASSTAFVGLFGTDGAIPLYRRHGFTHGDMTGMFRLVEPASS